MIRHIVFFSAKDKADIDQVIDGLSILTGIPHARKLEVARNKKTDQLGNDVDAVVYGEFDDEAALAAFKAHDLYHESIRRVRPIRDPLDLSCHRPWQRRRLRWSLCHLRPRHLSLSLSLSLKQSHLKPLRLTPPCSNWPSPFLRHPL